MVKFVQHGDFHKLNSYLERLKEVFDKGILDKYGEMGVEALREATPKDSGKTADSWDYIITHNKSSASIVWTNSNINEGVNIAIILQYGHGLDGGGYVQGIDYINPAMKEIFEKIAEEAWKEVTKV